MKLFSKLLQGEITIYFHYLFLEDLFFKEFFTKWKLNLNPQVFKKPTCSNSC